MVTRIDSSHVENDDVSIYDVVRRILFERIIRFLPKKRKLSTRNTSRGTLKPQVKVSHDMNSLTLALACTQPLIMDNWKAAVIWSGSTEFHDPVVFAHLQCGLEPRNLDGTNFDSCWWCQRAKESSYFHVHGSHLYVSLAWSFRFSLPWPTLLICSGRARVTAAVLD